MSGETLVPHCDPMEAPRGEIPFLFLPSGDLFARRADRLRHLSTAHALGDYLNFMALIADAQQDSLNRLSLLSPPDAEECTRRREKSMPLLDVLLLSRNPEWRSSLNTILQRMSGAALPQAASETVADLMQAGEASLGQKADRILAGELVSVSPRELPFIAASLQVYLVKIASSLKVDAVGRLEQGGLCPICGSYPSVGIVRSGGRTHGLRYLSCSICSSQWHMVRIKCSSCEATHRIDYHIMEGSNGAVKAESCGNCNVYLKLLYLEKDPQMEATADDLATVALDMLMDKEGHVRASPNFLFHPGTSH